MQVEVMEARPPHVEFEKRAVEDRDASIAAGQYVAKDVDFVIVTPVGSKDRIERVATEWLDHMTQSANEDRIPTAWAHGYRKMYEMWKEGQEVPLNGVPILGWPLISPAQQQNLIRINVRTVEDLAQLNDEGIQRIGMGARALQQKAISWLATIKDKGRTAEANAALEAENAALKQRTESLEASLAEVRAQVAALSAAQSQAKVVSK